MFLISFPIHLIIKESIKTTIKIGKWQCLKTVLHETETTVNINYRKLAILYYYLTENI